MIRTAQPSDALAIHNLHTRSVRGLCANTYPKEVLDAWLFGRSPEGYVGIANGEMYVFEEKGVVVGFSHVIPTVLIALFVDPEHARKGVGAALFRHAVEFIRARGETPTPFEATLTALPFYLKMGCTEMRRSFVEKNSVNIETVLMRLPERANRVAGGDWPPAPTPPVSVVRRRKTKV